jgi:metal-responsive CopG/Arc/MetJ family transcriptional regulator
MRKGVRTGKDTRVKRQQPTEQISIRLPIDLLAQLDQAAETEDRSRAKIVAIALREWLERRQERR